MRRLFFTILALGGASFMLASAQNAKDSIIQRDLLLEKDYVPSIETAGKIYSTPDLEALKTTKTQVQFATSEMPTSLPSDYVALRAAEVQTPFPAQQQRGYVRLCGGNHYSFLGDAQWNILRGSKHVLDLNLWHRSMAVPDKTVNTAIDNDNRMQLNYKLHLNDLEIKASLSERLFNWHYYAEMDASQIGDLSKKIEYSNAQRSSDTKLQLAIQSKPWDKDFDYAFSVDGHLFNLAKNPSLVAPVDGVQEKEIDAKAALSYRLNEDWSASLNGRVRFLGYANQENVYRINTVSTYGDSIRNGLFLEINPQVQYHLDLWDFSLGIRLSGISGNSLKVAPTASVHRPLGGDLAFGVEIDGGQTWNSYRESLMRNPYLDPSIRLLPQYTPFEGKVILEYNPLSGMKIEPVLGYRVIKDMPMFFNAVPSSDPSLAGIYLYNFFSAEYADVSSFYAGMNMTYAYKDILRFNADFKYSYYQTYGTSSASYQQKLDNNQGKVWYLPAMEVNASMEINPIDRLALSFAYHWEGGRYASTEQSDFALLKDIHYLSATGSYRFLPQWNAFLQIKNGINQSYQVWHNYPNYGITGRIGLSYSF